MFSAAREVTYILSMARNGHVKRYSKPKHLITLLTPTELMRG